MSFEKRKIICDNFYHNLKKIPYDYKKGQDNKVSYWGHDEFHLYQKAKANNVIGNEYDDYETRPIVYNQNKFGFRSEICDPTDLHEYGIAVGSSNTWGSGIHLEDRFDTLIQKEIAINIINIGWPGGSIDYVSDQITHIILNNKNKPKFFIIEWPPLTRRTMWGLNAFMSITPHSIKIQKEIFENILDEGIEYFYGEAIKSRFITQKLLDHFNIPYYEWSITPDSSSVFDIEMQEYIDYARDGIHPGPKTNLEIKNKFIDFYNKNV